MLRTVITIHSPLGVSSQSVHLVIGNEAQQMDELDDIDFVSEQVSSDVVRVTFDASFSATRKAGILIIHYVEKLNNSLTYMYSDNFSLSWTNITAGTTYSGISIDSMDEYLSDTGLLELGAN